MRTTRWRRPASLPLANSISNVGPRIDALERGSNKDRRRVTQALVNLVSPTCRDPLWWV